MVGYLRLSGKMKGQTIYKKTLVNTNKTSRALCKNTRSVAASYPPKENSAQDRTIPNACLSTKSGKECKAGFPMDNRVNLEKPVLLCKGLAKEKGLPWRGRRGVLGQILIHRNCRWVDGTAPGLTMALSDSNTDVKINDRLPILPITHESSTRTRQCIPKDPVRRQRVIRRLTQKVARLQSTRNGYFGGYICKRQKLANTNHASASTRCSTCASDIKENRSSNSSELCQVA